ncbi:MAG: PH domain-containing protein [Bryobacteraceae bacterium]
MSDLVIRPTKKFIRIGYWTVFVLCCLAVGLYVNRFSDQPAWLLVLPALLFLIPIRAHLRQHFTKITIGGDKLRYEVGILSKTTRIDQLLKIQDVRVDQTVFQRMMHIGDLSMETAGETSRLAIPNIDDPQQVAEDITGAAQGQPMKRKPQARDGL